MVNTLLWKPILAGVPQSSILGPLPFLVYINDLPDELKSNVKFFADDTSLFSIVKGLNESVSILNNDLLLISKWAYRSNIFKKKKNRKFKLIRS